MVDNYDSFVYNLVHYLEEFGCQVTVIRNDELDIDMASVFDGLPNEAGIIKQLIGEFGPTKSILGVCLGHQAICEVYGGSLVQLDEVKHGVMSKISTLVNDESLFDGLENQFEVGRYHSWVIDKDSIPEVLEVTATDQEGQVMSIRHRDFDVKGVQFHPESILTPQGKKIISNWISAW